MARGGPKQYPSMSAYLEKATKPKAPEIATVLLWTTASIGSFSFLSVLAAIFANFGHFHLDTTLLQICVPASISGLCAGGVVAIQKLFPKREKPSPLELEAREVNHLLKKHLNERRLHRAGPEAVILLLEESARQYLRIQTSLATNFWRTSDLPPAYATLRDKARISADRAMNEIVVLLRPRLSETVKPQHWKDVVDEVAENLGFKSADRGYVMPGDLDPASNLAEGLRLVANEVEQASIRAITDIPNSTSAEANLRSCLSDLRALNEAESELDDTLKYRL